MFRRKNQNAPRKNPNATLAGGLPRTDTTLPERNIDYESRADELPLITAPPSSPEFTKQLKAFFQKAVETCGTSARSAAEQFRNIVTKLSLKWRGRWPTFDARTPKERKQHEREHKKEEIAEQQRRAEILTTLAQSDKQGRHEMESTKSPADIDKIFAGKTRAGQVVSDPLLGTLAGYDDTDRGRQVKPEGSGKDEDQEGFGFTRGAAGPAQVKNSKSRYQKWGTTQEQEARAEVLKDFQTEHLHRVESGVSCNLCACIILDSDLGFVDSEDSDDPEESDNADDSGDLVWKMACDHLENVHRRELNKFMNENLPAWVEAHEGLPGSTRGKKKTTECDVDHEHHRQEAIKRKEKDKVECRCGHVIYNPARDLN